MTFVEARNVVQYVIDSNFNLNIPDHLNIADGKKINTSQSNHSLWDRPGYEIFLTSSNSIPQQKINYVASNNFDRVAHNFQTK